MYIHSYIHTHIHTYTHTDIPAYIHTYIHTHIHNVSVSVPSSFHLSFLWAPPAANQLSVLRAPPVSTLVSSCHLITSFLWGTACGDSVFCCSGSASGDPCPMISSPPFCGPRLWRFSLLCCRKAFCTHVWATPVATL